MLKSEKPKEVEKIVELLNTYKVVGILSMHKIPGRQLQKIRDTLRGKIVIKMSRKNLLLRSLDACNKKNIATLKEHINDEPALILTNEDTFRLFKLIKKNRSPAKARVGDVVANDVMIPKGPTQISPGPAISTLQKAGLKTGVQKGKIAVMQDKFVVKAGEAVNDDVEKLFSLLNIEPMEIGLDLVGVLEDGVVYKKEVLDIDEDYYEKEIGRAAQQAINLSVNADYPTKLAIDIMIQKAFHEAKALSIDADIIEKDFIDELLRKAAREAKSLEESK